MGLQPVVRRTILHFKDRPLPCQSRTPHIYLLFSIRQKFHSSLCAHTLHSGYAIGGVTCQPKKVSHLLRPYTEFFVHACSVKALAFGVVVKRFPRANELAHVLIVGNDDARMS